MSLYFLKSFKFRTSRTISWDLPRSWLSFGWSSHTAKPFVGHPSQWSVAVARRTQVTQPRKRERSPPFSFSYYCLTFWFYHYEYRRRNQSTRRSQGCRRWRWCSPWRRREYGAFRTRGESWFPASCRRSSHTAIVGFFYHISLDFLFSIQVQLEEVEVVSGEEEEVRFALSHCRALDQSREVPSRQLAFSPRRRLTGIL